MKRIALLAMIMTLVLSGCGTTATDQVTSAQEAVSEKKEQLEEAATQLEEAASQLEEAIQEAVDKVEELTAEELLKRALEAMENVKSAKEETNMNLGIGLSLSESGMDFSMDMKLGLHMLSDISVDPVAAHMLMDYSYEMFGEEEKEEAEVYMREVDGKIVTYTRADDNWYSVEQEKEEVDTSFVFSSELFEMMQRDGVKLELANETEKVGDVEAYRIDVTLEGKMIAEAMNEMMQASDEELFDMEAVDWENLTTQLEVYIREDDNRLAAMVMDLTPIGETAIAQAMDLAEEAEELEGIEISVDEFNIRVDFLEYDIDPVEIPEAVLSEANVLDLEELDEITALQTP